MGRIRSIKLDVGLLEVLSLRKMVRGELIKEILLANAAVSLLSVLKLGLNKF